MQTSNIVIIGGGIMGLAAAWRLSEAGHSVILLEKEKCGSGSTCTSLGALVPYNPWREDETPTLQRESLRAYPTFVKELWEKTGIDVAYKQNGRIQVIQTEKQLEQLSKGAVIACEKWGTMGGKPIQEILTPEQLKRIEPELEPTAFGALLCRATANFSPSRMVAALRSACMKNGVDIRENSPAGQIVTSAGKITAVHSATGPIATEKVILAAGAWSKNLLPKEAYSEKYVSPLKGQAVELSHPKLKINHMIRGLNVYLIKSETGSILLGGTKEPEAGFNTGTTEEALDFLLKKAEELVPAIAEAKVVKQWSGLRPYSEQGKPITGWDKTVQGLYHLTGHAGIGLCMTPYASAQVLKDFS